MKKIKPQYGKVIAPAVNVEETQEKEQAAQAGIEQPPKTSDSSVQAESKAEKPAKNDKANEKTTPVSRLTSEPNPFLQTKEVFAKARLTKIGYRMRSEYVEILDIIKKVKKGGYTLEAVLDDALTYYFENSEDGREAIKKAEIFYS